MFPFKTISILSSTLAALSVLAIPMWALGVPGIQNEYARGWKMGFGVILAYPVAWAINYLPFFLFKSRLNESHRERWQNIVSALAILVFLIAAARMFQAWRIMLDKSGA